MVTQRSTTSRISLPVAAAFILASTLAACGSNTPAPASTVPTVNSTSPSSAATGVARNSKVSAIFSEAMDPASLTDATVFVKQGTTAVPGTLALASGGTAATFSPTTTLTASTAYTATITAGSKAATGTAMAADETWTFTTGTTSDTTAPTVVSTSPTNTSTGSPVNGRVTVTFSEAMDPVTLTGSTFTVKQAGTAVAGTVSLAAGGLVATFSPTSYLTASTAFTTAITSGATDMAGNALAAPFSASFTTGTGVAVSPAPVLLGTSGNFAILAKTAISTVPASVLTGDIGVSPAAASFITGFSLVADSTNVFSTATQVTGKAFAANMAVPTPTNLSTAVGDMQTAYTDAASRPTPDFLELGTGNIGGQTLVPGLYKWTSTVTVPADVVLAGGANDVWIFQTTGDVSVSAAKKVSLSGGALAKNVFWQVAGKVVMGAGSHFEGVILAKTQINMLTGATMNGRALAQTQVTLDHATITQPAP